MLIFNCFPPVWLHHFSKGRGDSLQFGWFWFNAFSFNIEQSDAKQRCSTTFYTRYDSSFGPRAPTFHRHPHDMSNIDVAKPSKLEVHINWFLVLTQYVEPLWSTLKLHVWLKCVTLHTRTSPCTGYYRCKHEKGQKNRICNFNDMKNDMRICERRDSQWLRSIYYTVIPVRLIQQATLTDGVIQSFSF